MKTLLIVLALLVADPAPARTRPINFQAWDAPAVKTSLRRPPIDFTAWDPPKVRNKPIDFTAWDAPRRTKLIQVGTIEQMVCTPYGYCKTVRVPQFAEVPED